jgi:gp16 family phage-associated protein
MKKSATPEQLRTRLSNQGKTLAELCREKNVDYKTAVQLVNGFSKGRYGKAHAVAVKLGLKEAA